MDHKKLINLFTCYIRYQISCRIVFKMLLAYLCAKGIWESVKRFHNSFDNCVNSNDQFATACINGDLGSAKKLYETGSININAYNSKALINATHNEHIAIINWLLSLDGIDINDEAQDLLCEYACDSDNRELAQLLHTKHRIFDKGLIKYLFYGNYY